jgi:hypothetical protein
MLVNICCSPSSGSTFFSQILDRHPAVACGDELWLFCKPLLYDDYERFRKRRPWIRVFGLSGRPYHESRDIFRHTRGYVMRRRAFWRWAAEAPDLHALADRMERHVKEVTGKPVWAEKTPWNIRVIGRFIESFPDARVIHIVRDPRDVILSLARKRRSRRWLRWASTWLASVAAIQPYRARANVIEIRYEDLCTEPASTLRQVCEFLGVAAGMRYFRGDTMSPSVLAKARGHPGWRLRPDRDPSARSIGSYRDYEIDWRFLAGLRLAPAFAELLGTRQWSVIELAQRYGYAIPTAPAEALEHAYRPLSFARRLNAVMGWLDRTAGVPPYMPQTVCSLSSPVGDPAGHRSIGSVR